MFGSLLRVLQKASLDGDVKVEGKDVSFCGGAVSGVLLVFCDFFFSLGILYVSTLEGTAYCARTGSSRV